MGSNPKSHLSPGQIVQKCYDESQDRIRVDAQYNTTISGDIEISVDASTDSIAVKSSTTGYELQPNADGSITADISGSFPSTISVTQGTTPWIVDGSGVTQPISAVSLPLPSGAATSANQTTANSSLSSIDSKTPALGQALAAASVPVVLTLAQLSTLTPLTSVTVTQATGTNLHAVIDSGTISLPTGASTSANQTTANTSLSSIDGRFNSSTSTLTNVSSSASSVQLLASTSGRKAAYFYNDSTQVAYVKLGTTASATSYTIQMAAGSFLAIDNNPVYTGRIDAIWAAANGTMRVTELT